MLQVGQMGLNDAHHEVKRNACFLLGLVYLNMSNDPQSIPSLASALPAVLQGIKPYVEGRGNFDGKRISFFVRAPCVAPCVAPA